MKHVKLKPMSNLFSKKKTNVKPHVVFRSSPSLTILLIASFVVIELNMPSRSALRCNINFSYTIIVAAIVITYTCSLTTLHCWFGWWHPNEICSKRVEILLSKPMKSNDFLAIVFFFNLLTLIIFVSCPSLNPFILFQKWFSKSSIVIHLLFSNYYIFSFNLFISSNCLLFNCL